MNLNCSSSDEDIEFPVEGGDHEGNDNPSWQEPADE